MSDIFERAMDALKALPAKDRDKLCWEIVERIEDKSQWSTMVATPASQRWLEKTAKTNLAIYSKQTKRVVQSPLTVSTEGFQREPGYWNTFAELPAGLQALAEDNFRLWQTNPASPRLKLKQIHTRLPIFSFRVGLQHRTIGVRAPDDRMIWFWIGSVDDYKQMLAQD